MRYTVLALAAVLVTSLSGCFFPPPHDHGGYDHGGGYDHRDDGRGPGGPGGPPPPPRY